MDHEVDDEPQQWSRSADGVPGTDAPRRERGGVICTPCAARGTTMTATEDYTFVCPECGESLSVNDSMRNALIDNGCVICGSSVQDEAFTAA